MGRYKKEYKDLRDDPFHKSEDYYLYRVPNPIIHDPEYFKKWYSKKSKKTKDERITYNS